MTIGSAYTIGNCINNLPTKFGNRQNFGFPIPGTSNYTYNNLADGSLATLAVMEAIKELTETYEFEELKYQTPVPSATPLSMTAGNPIIPLSTLLGTIQTNAAFPQFATQNWVDITDVFTFWMWFSGGVNFAGRTLKYRRVTTIDTYSYGITSNLTGQLGVAPPVYYTRFGNILQVGPVPDQNYNYFVRVKLRHPFPVAGSTTFVPATLTCSILAGVVNAVTVVSGGSGYLPSVTIPLTFGTSPTGAVATGTATVNSSGAVTAGVVTSGGSGYVTAPTVNTAAIQAQQVFAPDSWQEIFELSACLRLAIWEGASEYVAMFKALLNGNPEDPKEPGLIKPRIPQMKREEGHNERQLSLRTAQYTYSR
jgi:hypothetical protein